MREGGRSIVWCAVERVLSKWSELGRIGSKVPPAAPEDGALEEYDREAWAANLRAKASPRGFYPLTRDQIDDIAAEVSAEIERRLEALATPRTGKPKRPFLAVLEGGKDDH